LLKSTCIGLALLLAAHAPGQNLDEARRVQAKVLGVDTHNDTAQRVLIDKVDIGQRLPDGIDLPRLREGGVKVPFFALWVPSYYPGAEAVRRTLDLRDAMQGVFDKHPDQIELATSERHPANRRAKEDRSGPDHRGWTPD
jgi:hypothetical protein